MKTVDNTWFKFYRSFEDWEWFDDKPTRDLFLYCLIKANYKEAEWQGIIIPIGSFITSVKKLSDKLGYTERQTRTAIEHLKTTNNITTKTTNKWTMINVVNWGIYQGGENKNDKQDDKQDVIQTTNKRQTRSQTNDNKYIKKELKEYKEEKELKDLNTTFVLLENDGKGENIPYKEIIEFLNEKTGLNLRHTTNKTRDLIKARWNEGFRLEEFKSAIKNAVKFRTKPNGEIDTRYLMPKTIFNGSFESRVLGTTYQTKPKAMQQEENVDELKGRYDKFIMRD